MKTIEKAAKELYPLNKPTMYTQFVAGLEQSAFKAGVEFAQRWISVEEELPPLNEYVLFKYSEGEYCVGCLNNHGYYCTTYIPADNDFSSIHLLSEVTHWRQIEIK